MTRFKVVTAGIAIAFGLSMAPAFAKDAVKAGVLDCDVSGGVGLILGSSKAVACTFKKGNGRVEHYEGKLGKLGIDIGATGKASMAWVVFAPGKVKNGALAGTYAGASAEATAGAGLGANVLIGGFGKTISLQPVSVQGQTGLNVAAGLASLSLSYVD